MPINYHIDVANKLVTTTIEGEISDEQLIQHVEKMAGDTGIDSSFAELIRIQSTSIRQVTNAGMWSLSGSLKGTRRMKRVAIAAFGDAEFGMARMYELLNEDTEIQIRVFRDETEAVAWLEGK